MGTIPNELTRSTRYAARPANEFAGCTWASDYDEERNVLEFSQRTADELDPAEFMATALQLLTDAGLAPKGRERRIYELTRERRADPRRAVHVTGGGRGSHR